MIASLRMNRCVPDFEITDDYSLPPFAAPRKPPPPDDDVVELLWQNGQLVTHSQNQRALRKSPPSKFEVSIPQDPAAAAAREIRPPSQLEPHDLFIQEDEMASWLNYPLVDDHNFCSDLLYPAITANPQLELRPSVTVTTTVTLAPRPPMSSARRIEAQSSAQFSRNKATVESEPSNSKVMVRESTVVDSCDTPSVGPESRASEMAKRKLAEAVNGSGNVPCEIVRCGSGVIGGMSVGGDGVGDKEMTTCEITVTSSPGDSSASAEPASPKAAADDRKRKGRAPDDTECQSEDVEYESPDAKKQFRGSTSTKRSRAAEVHNLSERRRRDRINEKMKALQELIPRCNKTDKASMLDEAIEYLKTLQLQVQMMSSMGCGMMPVMFPGVQQYLPPPMGMGIGMGMGMGMEMGMNGPIMPFPNLLAGSNLPMQAGAAAHLGPRFPLPAFAMPPVPGSHPSRVQPTNQASQMPNSLGTQHTTPTPVSGFSDSYQQFLSSDQMQFPAAQPLQNQQQIHLNTSRPCTNTGPENFENHQSG